MTVLHTERVVQLPSDACVRIQEGALQEFFRSPRSTRGRSGTHCCMRSHTKLFNTFRCLTLLCFTSLCCSYHGEMTFDLPLYGPVSSKDLYLTGLSPLQLAAHQLCRAPEAVVMTDKSDLIKEFPSLLELARYLAYCKFWHLVEEYRSALASVILSYCTVTYDDLEQERAQSVIGRDAYAYFSVKLLTAVDRGSLQLLITNTGTELTPAGLAIADAALRTCNGLDLRTRRVALAECDALKVGTSRNRC